MSVFWFKSDMDVLLTSESKETTTVIKFPNARREHNEAEVCRQDDNCCENRRDENERGEW